MLDTWRFTGEMESVHFIAEGTPRQECMCKSQKVRDSIDGGIESNSAAYISKHISSLYKNRKKVSYFAIFLSEAFILA